MLMLAGGSAWIALRSNPASDAPRSMDVSDERINAGVSAPIEHEATRVAQATQASIATEPVSGSASSGEPNDGADEVPEDYPFDPRKRVPWFDGPGAQYRIEDREQAMRNLSKNLGVNLLQRPIGPRELELIHLECSFAHDQFHAAEHRYSELSGQWGSKKVRGSGGIAPERFASEKEARAFLDAMIGTEKPGEWTRITSVHQDHENGVHFWRAGWADPFEEIELYRARHEMLILARAFSEAIRLAIARLPPS